MRVFNANGDTINIQVGGRYSDDIQVLSAEYEMHPEETVSDTEIEWILKHHADAVYQEWLEQRIDAAESIYDAAMDAAMGL